MEATPLDPEQYRLGHTKARVSIIAFSIFFFTFFLVVVVVLQVLPTIPLAQFFAQNHSKTQCSYKNQVESTEYGLGVLSFSYKIHKR